MMLVKSNLMCILCTGTGDVTYIDSQTIVKHFNEKHDAEFDEDFVINIEKKDEDDKECNIEGNYIIDKLLCVICSSEGTVTFVDKQDESHFKKEHKCEYDQDFLLEVNTPYEEDMSTDDDTTNMDEVTAIEVVDKKFNNKSEIKIKTDEDTLRDALKDLFIKEEKLRKMTEEIDQSFAICEIKIETTEAKNHSTNIKINSSKNKVNIIEIKNIEKNTSQSSKPQKINESKKIVNQKPKFTCDVCNQGFAYKGNLKKHMTKIHGQPNTKTLQIIKNLPRPIQKHLMERNYHLILIKGDGHCLFRSLAHGLNMFISSTQPAHLKVRAEISYEGLKKPSFFSNLATYYLPTEGPAAFNDRMIKVQQVVDAKGPVWGNNVEIIIATKLYQVDIYKLCFIPATGKEYYQVFAAHGGGRRAERFLVLLYDISVPGAEHFSLLQSGERPVLKQGTPIRCYEEQKDGAGKFSTVRAL